MDRSLQVAFLRDWAVVTALAGSLAVLGASVELVVLQLPYYLLIVGFDLVQVAVGAWAGYEPVQLGLYVVLVGLLAASVSHAVRTRAPETGTPGWRLALASFVALLAGLALLLAAVALLGTNQREPVVTAGTAGVVGLVLAAWLGGLYDVQVRTAPAKRE